MFVPKCGRNSALRRRRGAALVEVAFVGPVALLFVIGILVAGIGVFRFQQVSTFAREGARWASMRGPQYEKLSKAAPITASDVYQNAIAPLCGNPVKQEFDVELNWGANRSVVSVTVRHLWKPQAFLKPVELRSRSECPVAN